jgi:hypothetical protein
MQQLCEAALVGYESQRDEQQRLRIDESLQGTMALDAAAGSFRPECPPLPPDYLESREAKPRREIFEGEVAVVTDVGDCGETTDLV